MVGAGASEERSMLDRKLKKSVEPFEFQFLAHMCPVILNRPEADMQFVCDFFAGFVLGNEFEDTSLGAAELLQGIPLTPTFFPG